MFEYEEMFLEAEDSLLDDEGVSVEESYIDPEDEMSIVEAMLDIEIAEACKKEACKKEACKKEACKKEGCGKGSTSEVCEKCGKPIEQCECGN